MPTTSHSDEETDNFYNTINKILEKETHYTTAMGDLMRKLEDKQMYTSERVTGCFGLGPAKWKRRLTIVEFYIDILLILPDLSSKMRPCGGKSCTEEEEEEALLSYFILLLFII